MQTFPLSSLFKAQMSSLHLVMMSDLLQPAHSTEGFMCILSMPIMALQNYLKLILRKHSHFKIIGINPEWSDNSGEISQ